MIQLSPHMRILVAVEAVDFRCGIDGMARLCREVLRSEPMSGGIFVFRSRRGTSIKILVYDGQGFWLCQKRLSRGTFRWWPRSGEQGTLRLEAYQLQVLLWNGDPLKIRAATAWRPLALAS